MTTLGNSPKINFRTVLFLAGVTLIVSNPCSWAHTDVTAQQARDLIASTNDLIVVDVREQYEYCDDIGHIPWALNYPLSSGILEARFEELPMHSPILVVYRSGGRSNAAANFLDSNGYSMVYDMMGGMNAWIWETEPCKSGRDDTVSAETSTYVFLPDQSTLLQTGGIAGVNFNYSVEGHFQLTVDKDAGTASFTLVDANAADESPFQRTLDPNEVFNMTSLRGIVLNETTISFADKADDGSDIFITLIIEDDLVYLVGETIPPPNTADFFIFNLDAIAQRKYTGGTGEPKNPYQIWTPKDFVLIAYRREDWSKHFTLMRDLDMSTIDSNEIIPIGDENTAFTGSFNGAGHSIFNIRCQLEQQNNVGIFGILVAPTPDPNGVIAVVKNLCLVNAEILGGFKVGGLVGWNRGTITGCSVEGIVAGLSQVGGLVGVNCGEINTCFSKGTVLAQQDMAGGLVGQNIPILWNIIGPELSGNGWAGISKSFSSAHVTGEREIGGLVGIDNGKIENCYSSGSVTGQDNVGGLVGDSRGRTMNFCYSTAYVIADVNAGGLIGSRPYYMEDHAFCVWDIDTSNISISAAGRGKTSEEMMSSKTYYCWGIDDNWTIDEGNDYPHLTWENHTGVPVSEYDRLYGGGSGDANDPYLISTPQQLITVGWYEEDYDKHYLLITNLDFNDIISTEIRPIGNAKVAFTGVFDGQGYIISRIKLRSWNRNVGVFGVVGNRIPEGLLQSPWISEVNAPGFVRNLHVSDANLTGSDMQGVLVGLNVNGTISGCSVTGSVGAEDESHNVLGGLVGRNKGLIEKCTASCYINGGYFIGGLVGSNYGTIQSSYSTGEITGSALHIGGLSGDNTGNILNCGSQCLVRGGRQVGGLVGSNYNNSEIIDCSSLGDVSGEEHIGGLVGLNTGSVINSYSAGIINGTGEYIGGLVGNNEEGKGHTTASFWDIETSGLNASAGGMGLTTEEMQDVSTYLNAGWDFVDEVLNGTCDYWQIAPGDYPRLHYHFDNYPMMPEGQGTTQQPYLIRDVRDLGTVWFESAANYRLEASVDLSGITWSIPVIPSFGGTFDGNGYTISHLTVLGHRDLGLFGRLRDGADIKDLGVVDVNIAGSGSNVGSLAGSNKGRITASYSTGTITGDRRVSGLVGENNGDIIASYSTGMVTGEWGVGGLVGQNNGAITASYSTGTATGYRCVGGLIGYNNGEVNHCYSSATATGDMTWDRWVGGLVAGSGWGITASFWDIQTSGQATSNGGIGKTTTQMQTATTFLEAGWDFVDETLNGTDDIWWILEGQDYPGLWWQYGLAFSPRPQDGATDVIQPVILSWLSGGSGLHHEVYFGEDGQAVANATTESPVIYRGRLPLEVTTFDPGMLALDTAYYWRIDEVNEDDLSSSLKGNVWNFTTADFLIVDDFESYNDLDPSDPKSNRLWMTWIDGYDSTIFNGSTVSPVEPPFSEQSIIHGGNQSMSFLYDNSGPANFSQATANIDRLAIDRDWTKSGIKILSLWFYGFPDNAPEPMYVALANADGKPAMVYHVNPDAALINTWTQWNIYLQEFLDQGVDLTNINWIYIGFGNKNNPQPGGAGHMYFDDIRLYQPVPPELEQEP